MVVFIEPDGCFEVRNGARNTHLECLGDCAMFLQIDTRENEELVQLFSPQCQTTVRHGAGHIVPTGKTMIAQYVRFLQQFVDGDQVNEGTQQFVEESSGGIEDAPKNL